MPLNPVFANLLESFAAAGRPALSAGSVAQARALMASGRTAYGEGPDILSVEDVAIGTRTGPIPGRLYRDHPEPIGLVVYLHGGGWVLGSIEEFDGVTRLLAKRSGCAILSVAYRLAPEHPFPAPVDDAVDATLWASRNLRRLAGAEVPLVVAGDSAGGNLAAVAAAELAGTVPLAAQVLIYPVTDRDFERPSYRAHATTGILGRRDMMWFFDLYAPGAARDAARLSPISRGSLSGLPPAHVVTAEYDVLRDEGEDYAARLEAAGVPTTSRRYDGLIHGFIRFHNLVDAVDEALAHIAAEIRRVCEAQRMPAETLEHMGERT